MSIGKNLNIGAKKGEAKVKDAPMKEKETLQKEQSDQEKLKVINESVAGQNVPAISPEKTEDSVLEEVPMIAEGENMLIVFPVGDEEYAIAIDDIKEVVPTPPIAHIPQVPDYILGIANVRGNVLAVMDLEKRFVKQEKIENDKIGKFVLVIKSEDFQIAVIVPNVPNTMIVLDTDVDSPSNIISQSSMNMKYVKGIIKKEKRMIIWIDIHDVMSLITSEDLI